MFIIGLILLAAAAVVGIDVAAVNSTTVDFEAFGHIFVTNTAVLFVAGVITAFVACLGVFLMTDGAGRTARRRAHRREVEAERDRLAAEAEQLHAERDRRQATLDLRGGDEPSTRTSTATTDHSERLNA